MNDGKHCPSCGKDTGLWTVFAAGLPNRIKCPHCKARLWFRGGMPVALAMLVLLVPLMYGSFHAARTLGDDSSWRWIFAGLVLVLWAPVELALSLYLRECRTLEVLSN